MADDDGDLRRLMAAALRRSGHAVVEAADGPEVLHHLGRDGAGIGALVTDLRMPTMDGLSVLSHLARRRLSVPAVLLTGCAEPAVIERAEALGAVTLLKPVTMDLLRQTVRSVLVSGARVGGRS